MQSYKFPSKNITISIFFPFHSPHLDHSMNDFNLASILKPHTMLYLSSFHRFYFNMHIINLLTVFIVYHLFSTQNAVILELGYCGFIHIFHKLKTGIGIQSIFVELSRQLVDPEVFHAY